VSAKRIVVKYGVPLVLASASYLGFVHDWEADKKAAEKVYADRLARGEPTVCDGITNAVSPYPVIVGDIWSAERCEEVNSLVATKTQLKLLDCVKTAIQQNTFDALSSHAHNVGVGNTCASRALGLINAGRLAEGCAALANGADGNPVWSYTKAPDGKLTYIPGLYNRRVAEAALCVKRAG
jgi:GH24 family phage-related lysozyme (muramidase)